MGKVGKGGRLAPRGRRRRPPIKLTESQVKALLEAACSGATEIGSKDYAALERRGLVVPGRVTDKGLDKLATLRGDPLGELSSLDIRRWYLRLRRPSPMLDALAGIIADLRARSGSSCLDDAASLERVYVFLRVGAYKRARKAAWAMPPGTRRILPNELCDVLYERMDVDYGEELPEDVWRQTRLPVIDRLLADGQRSLAALQREKDKLLRG